MILTSSNAIITLGGSLALTAPNFLTLVGTAPFVPGQAGFLLTGSGSWTNSRAVVKNTTVWIGNSNAISNTMGGRFSMNDSGGTGSALYVLDGITFRLKIVDSANNDATSGATFTVGMNSSGTSTLSGADSSNTAFDLHSRNTGATNNAWYLQATAGAQVNVTGLLINTGTNASDPITKIGPGAFYLANTANTFGGKVSINEGTLAVANLANPGSNSSLGTGNGTSSVDVGASGTTGTLQFLGSASGTTNRVINLAGTTGGGALDASGSGSATVTFTGNLGVTGSGAKSLTLTGINTGANTFSGNIADTAGMDTVAVAKTGVGTWVLSGSNSYSGGTTVTGGILSISGTNSLPSLAATISGSGALVVGNAVNDASFATILASSTFVSGGNIGFDTASGSRSYSSPIAGAQGLVATGTGVLTLSGSNSYSGGTSVRAGMLSISSTDSLPSLTATVSGSGALVVGNAVNDAAFATILANSTFVSGASIGFDTTGANRTFSGSVGGSQGLMVAGGSTLTLSGSNSFTGGVTFAAGGLTIANASALGNGGVLTVTKDADITLNFNLPTSGTVANAINITKPGVTHNDYIVQNANNNLTLAGVVTGTGHNVNFNAGTGITSGTITLTGSNVLSGNVWFGKDLTLRFGNNYAAGTNTTLRVAGSGETTPTSVIVLDGVNLQTSIAADAATSDASPKPVYIGMEASGTASIVNGIFMLNSSSNGRIYYFQAPAGAQFTTSSALYGGTNSPVVKTGSGTVVFNYGSSSYSGPTTISGGILQVSTLANGASSSSIGSSTNGAANLVLNGGTLKYTGGTVSTDRQFTLGASGGGFDASGSGVLTLSSTGTVAYSGSGNRALTLGGTNTGANTLAANLSDNGADVVSLVKNGTGKWVLSGSNSFTGTTTINGGTLGCPIAQSLPTYAVTVNNGGRLQLNVGGTNEFTTANLDALLSGTAGSTFNAGSTLALDTTNYGGALTYTSIISGNLGIAKIGTNNLTLSSSNTYLGATRLTGAALAGVVLANGGVPSSIGQSSNAASNLIIETGAQMNLAVSCTTDRLFTLGSSGQAWIASVNGTLFSNTGDIAVSGAASHNLRLGGGGTSTFAPAVHDYNVSNKTQFSVQNCTWIITGTNSDYTGVTNIDATSTLIATSLANGGVPSSIGASSNAASNLVFGYDAAGGNNTLRYIGNGTASTDRLFTLGTKLGTGDTSMIDNSGGGTLSFTNTGSIAVTSTVSTTLAFSGSNSINFAPLIVNGSGTVGVTKSGSSIVTLTGANAYTGVTTITGGTLQVGNGGTIGSIASTSSVSISSGATIAFNRIDGYGGSFSKAISGAGGLALNSGTLALTGTNTYSGPTSIASGAVLQIGDGVNGMLSGASLISVISGATLNINLANSGTFGGTVNSAPGVVNFATSGTATVSGQVAGYLTGVVNLNGPGTTIWNNNNQFFGTTNVNGGVLQLASLNSAYNSTVNVGPSGTLTFGASAVNVGELSGSGSVVLQNAGSPMTMSVGANNLSTTFAGVLSGNGALTMAGTNNVLSLTGVNTYTGLTTVSSGTLRIGNGGTTGSIASSGTVSIASGATLVFNRSDDYGGAFAVPMAGSGRMLVSTGTLTLSSTGSFSGDIAVSSGGTLMPGIAAPLPSGNLSAEGGTLNFGPLVSASFGGLKGSGNLNIVGTSGSAMTLTVGGNNQVNVFNGSLSGSNLSLTKVGTGTLTLGGSSSFTGGVNVASATGSITVTNPYALGSGLLQTTTSVDTGLHFNLATSGTVANAITYLMPIGIRNDFIYQDANNNLTLAGNINSGGNNVNIAAGSGITSGTITLSGSNSFGGNVYFSKNLTIRVGGNYGGGNNCSMRVAGTGETTPTSVWVLDGVNMQANIAADAATSDMSPKPVYVGMESSGTASMVDLYMLNSASNGRVYYVQTPVSAQFTIGGPIYGGTNSSLVKTGSGTAIFVRGSAYTTPVTVAGGVLQVAVLANGGVNSSLGASTSAASNLTLDGGTLRYTGGTVSTDRQFTLGANGGGIEANGSGPLTLSSASSLAFTGVGNRTLTLGGTNLGLNTLAASVADNGADIVSLVKSGAGTWVLSGVNSYSGGTTVNNGTLSIASVSSLPTGSLTVSGSGALTVGNAVDDTTVTAILAGASFAAGAGFGYDTTSGDRTAGSDIGGALGLVKIGGNTLTLTGNNTYTGTTTLSSGTLAVGDGGTAGSLGAGAVTNNGTLVFNHSDSISLGNLVSGTGSLKQAGSGMLTLTSSNSYTGATLVNSGTLALAGSGALARSTAITINGGTLDMGSLNATNLNGSNTGVSFGSNGGTLTGSGTLTITGQTGGASSFVLAAGATAVVNENLVLSTTNASGYQALATFGVGANLTINGKITGPGGLFLSANGTLTLTNTSNNFGSLGCWGAGSLLTVTTADFATLGTQHLMVMEQNTSQAPTTLIYTGTSASTPFFFQSGGLAPSFLNNGSGTVTFTGTYFDAPYGTPVSSLVQTFTLGGSSDIVVSSVIQNTNPALTSGSISFVMGLAKTGAGTLKVSGSNTYTGPTAINEGTLQIGNGGTTGAINPASAITNNATLAFNRSNTLTQGTDFASTISGSGNVLQIGSGVTILSGSNSYSGGTTVTNGTLRITNANALAAGPTAVNGGVLQYQNPVVLASATMVSINSGGSLGLSVGGTSEFTSSDLNTVLAGGSGVTFNAGSAVALDTTNAGGTFTHSAVISGMMGISKIGTGNLSLSSSNTYLGATRISAGSIINVVMADGGLPSSIGQSSNAAANLIIENGAVLNIGTSGTTDRLFTLGSSGQAWIAGAGGTVFSNTGDIAVSGSASHNLRLGGAGTNTFAPAVHDYNSSNKTQFSVQNCTWNVTGTNSDYTGVTNIDADATMTVVSLADGGVASSIGAASSAASNLVFGYDAAGGNNTLSYIGVGSASTNRLFTLGTKLTAGNVTTIDNSGGGALNFTGTGAIAVSTSASTTLAFTGSSAISFAPVIGNGSGTVALQKSGANTLTLTGANTYTGSTTINGGTLQIGDGGVTGSISTSSAIVNNATLAFNRANTITQGTDFASTISGSGNVVQAGSGTTVLSGSNSFSGGTTVSAGTLQVGNANALGTGGLAVNGGTLDLHGNDVNVGALSGSAGSSITNSVAGTKALTTTINSGTSTYAGNITNGAGSVELTKDGTGTLLLSGSLSMAGLNATVGVTELTQSGSIGVVNVGASGMVRLAAHTSGSAYTVLDTNSLSITSGGSIDLWNNAMILRASGTSENAANLTTVKAAVNAASNSLQWNGVGIGSTTAFNEAQPQHTQALALMVYDNTVIKQGSFEGVSGLGYFDGESQPVGFNQVLVKLTYLGDFNADGIVNASDYTWLDGYALGANSLGDLNGDGVVNATDYTWLDGSALNQSFGVLADATRGGDSLSAPVAAAVPAGTSLAPASPEAVPEPGALSLLLAGAAGLLGFRRKTSRAVRQ